MPHKDTSVAIIQTINRAINVIHYTSLAIIQDINQALHATQEHKSSYHTSYQLSSEFTHGHKHWLSHKLFIDLYPMTRYDLNPTYFNSIQLLYTVIKAGFLV